MNKNYPGRNSGIVEMYLSGANFQEVADEFGLTRQRVEQIVRGRTKERHRTSLKRKSRDLKIFAAFERVKEKESTVEKEAEALGVFANSLLVNWAKKGLYLPREPKKLHGTRNRYNQGCRCAECTETVKLYMRTLIGRPPRKHGTKSAYVNYGCRCDPCKRAGAAHNREYRERRKRRESGLLHGVSAHR